MNITNKNIIVGFLGHIFTVLYVDVLVKKCQVPADSIVFISLDSIEQYESFKNDFPVGVHFVHYSNVDVESLLGCKTITTISLSTHNSWYLSKLCDFPQLQDKIYIHLTDDEIERWVKTKEKYKILKPTKRNYFDDHCMKVLKCIKHFIAPEAYFKNCLDFLLPGNAYDYLDARDPFKSLPTDMWEEFVHILDHYETYTHPEKRILLGAKRGVFTTWQMICMIHALFKAGAFPEYKITIFTNKLYKEVSVWINLYLGYLRHIRKCNVDVAYPTVTNAFTYNAIVASCSHVVLQGRGSMSTARSYLSLGRGRVYVLNGTPNEAEFMSYDSKIITSYQNYNAMALSIVNNVDSYKYCSDVIINNFNAKYNRLCRLYNSIC